MGIREEIEKLDCVITDGICYMVHLSDVLAILDRYEVVDEHEFYRVGWIDISEANDDALTSKHSESISKYDPGDHLLILREKGVSGE